MPSICEAVQFIINKIPNKLQFQIIENTNFYRNGFQKCEPVQSQTSFWLVIDQQYNIGWIRGMDRDLKSISSSLLTFLQLHCTADDNKHETTVRNVFLDTIPISFNHSMFVMIWTSLYSNWSNIFTNNKSSPKLT